MKMDFKISCLFKEPNLHALTITMPGTPPPGTPVAFLLRHTKCGKNASDVYFSQLTLHEVILKSNVNLYTNAANDVHSTDFSLQKTTTTHTLI